MGCLFEIAALSITPPSRWRASPHRSSVPSMTRPTSLSAASYPWRSVGLGAMVGRRWLDWLSQASFVGSEKESASFVLMMERISVR